MGQQRHCQHQHHCCKHLPRQRRATTSIPAGRPRRISSPAGQTLPCSRPATREHRPKQLCQGIPATAQPGETTGDSLRYRPRWVVARWAIPDTKAANRQDQHPGAGRGRRWQSAKSPFQNDDAQPATGKRAWPTPPSQPPVNALPQRHRTPAGCRYLARSRRRQILPPLKARHSPVAQQPRLAMQRPPILPHQQTPARRPLLQTRGQTWPNVSARKSSGWRKRDQQTAQITSTRQSSADKSS